MNPTPWAFLSEAERLLGEGGGPPGVWPRACVWLTRLALEATLDDLWAARLPQARGISMRAQLLLLPDHLGADTSQQARRSWLGLSRAAHHHRVELAPTVAELRGWHAEVTAVVAAVTSATETTTAETTATVTTATSTGRPATDARLRRHLPAADL